MIFSTLTYSTFIQTIITFIKNNCDNFDNYSKISNAFKSGYSTVISSGSGSQVYISKCYRCLGWTPIQQENITTVKNQLINFLNKYGISQQTVIYSQLNYIKFISLITSFCCSKLVYVSSSINSNVYLVYKSSNSVVCSNYLNQLIFNNLIKPELHTALIDNLMINIKLNCRHLSCTYYYYWT